MVKRCLYCGRYFVPDKRVGARQKACHREACKRARKQESQKNWHMKNPEYFKGDYWRVKEWRQKKKEALLASVMKQDMIPLSKPYHQLILLIPEDKTNMIQDEIHLRKVAGYTFAAYG